MTVLNSTLGTHQELGCNRLMVCNYVGRVADVVTVAWDQSLCTTRE